MVKVGDQCTITIESLSNSGDGVGRIDNKVIFVPLSCPQDVLDIEITQDKKSFFLGKIKTILTPSPLRALPSCEFFGSCGGCSLQHISYEAQVELKRKSLIETLQRFTGEDWTTNHWILHPSANPWSYRNRIQVHTDGKNYSFLKKGSHQKIKINSCKIAHPLLSHQLSLPVQASITGKLEWVIQENGSLKSYPVDPKTGTSDFGFRQVNDLQNSALINHTLSTIRDRPITNIYDLYCGKGNWTLAIQKEFPSVHCIGIDINPANIKQAQSNATPNSRFLLGPVEKLFLKQPEQPDLVILDPPRAGCDEALLHSLKQKKPRWLVYISCHPATFARDYSILVHEGFKREAFAAFDMFPHTPHLETWCLLRSESVR